MLLVEHDSEEDSLGTGLYDAGMDEERVHMWEHAERMTLLGESLWDRFEEMRQRFKGRVPEDVWEMVLHSAQQYGRYQAAMWCMTQVVHGDMDPDDRRVGIMLSLGMEASRSFYSWRATAIQTWAARLRAPI